MVAPYASCNAQVPLAQARACLAPVISANFCSSSSTCLPIASMPEHDLDGGGDFFFAQLDGDHADVRLGDFAGVDREVGRLRAVDDRGLRAGAHLLSFCADRALGSAVCTADRDCQSPAGSSRSDGALYLDATKTRACLMQRDR